MKNQMKWLFLVNDDTVYDAQAYVLVINAVS